jgi:hypothetical protein
MAHAALADPPGFSQLSKAEQIEYLQALWDRIRGDSEAVPVLESHLDEVEARLARDRSGEAAERSAFEVLDRLSGSAR